MKTEKRTGRVLCAAIMTLAVVLCALLLPNAVQTAEAATVASGSCGDDLTWTLDDAGTLTVSGTGPMWDWSYDGAPWYSNRSSIKKVTIGSGVTGIGECAFSDCYSLTSITIPDSVTSIGDETFYNCSSLTSVTIPNDVTSIGDHALYWCSGLTSVTIGDSVTSIEQYAFHGCSKLTSITIPDSVTCIGDEAFSACNGLTSVTIGNSVTSIGDRAFAGCSGLARVNITDLAVWCGISFANSFANPLYYAHQLYLNGELLTNLTIPDSVTSIEDYAFYNYNGLTSVTIGDSVTSIEQEAFYGCSGLTSLTFLGSAPTIGTETFYGVTATAYYPRGVGTWTKNVRQNYGGSITWVATSNASGDMDGDGEVTDADAIYLLMHTFFPEDYPVSGSCDYDGDWEITDADAIYLLMYTFFPEDYPLGVSSGSNPVDQSPGGTIDLPLIPLP